MPISWSTQTPPQQRRPARTVAWLSALSCLLFASCAAAADPASERLIDLIFDYRAQNGLPAIPVSPSLSNVAALHVGALHNRVAVALGPKRGLADDVTQIAKTRGQFSLIVSFT